MTDAMTQRRARVIRWLLTLGATAGIVLHALRPEIVIDAISLALLGVAVLPWLAPLFKSLELPGGLKVEFQELRDVADRAERTGLLAPPDATVSETEYSFQRVAAEDPNLALAGLRIEIERRLASIAEIHDIPSRRRGVGQLLRVLGEREILGHQERAVLADLTGLLSAAVHGAKVEPESYEWALEMGPRLIRALDQLAVRSGQGKPIGTEPPGGGAPS